MNLVSFNFLHGLILITESLRRDWLIGEHLFEEGHAKALTIGDVGS